MPAPDSCGPFFALAAATDELVFVWKVTGEMLWVNQTFERETGMNAADFGFRNADNPFIHPDDLPGVLAAMGAFIDSDAKCSPPIDNRFFDMWGRCRRLRSTLHKIDWDGESALMFVSRFNAGPEDDSGSEDRYRRLVEAADDGIVQLDDEGRVATANRRMHDLTGRRHIEMVRRPLPDLFVQQDRDAALAAWTRLRAGASAASFQARSAVGKSQARSAVGKSQARSAEGKSQARSAEGKSQARSAEGPSQARSAEGTSQARSEADDRWLDVKLARLEGGDTSVVALAIARDVTETRRLEAEVLRREKDESLGLLVGGIAHDLNNILTGVIANASDAIEQVEPGSLLAQALADVQLAGERAAVLGRSMLAYLGQAPTTVTRIDLDQLVRDTIRVVGPLLGTAVSVQLGRVSDTAVSGDAGQLGQVIMNLITNAAQALGSRGGNVRIETEPTMLADDVSDLRPAPPAPGRYVRMLVADDGPGMSAEVMDRIFEPYFTTNAPGRGLGLATTLGVLRRHGGAVRVCSSLGHGTTFEVFLPIAEHEPIAPRRAIEPKAVPRRSATVLFVDDEEAILRMAQRVLDRAGHRTITASRGAQALELLQSEPVDAVVLDSTLPDADGNTIAAKMRELVPGIPILRSSGYQAAGSLSADEPFLPKPYRVNELLAAVESLLAQ